MENGKREQIFIMFSIMAAAISPYLGYFTILCFIGFVIFKKRYKPLLNFLKNNIFFHLMVFFLVINTIHSKYSGYSMEALGIILLQIIIYGAIRVYFKGEAENLKLLDILVVTSIFISIVGIGQYFLLKPSNIPKSWVDKEVYNIKIRVYSTLYNPNVLAAYLTSMICMTITSLEDIKERPMDFIGLVLASICLVFTYSRGAWMAVGMILVLLIMMKKNKKYMLYGLLMLLFMGIMDGLERMNPKVAAHDSSLAYRMEIYRTSIQIFMDHYILGTGMNTMRVYIKQYSALIKAPVFHSHNMLLHVMTETGILGLILFIIGIIKTMKYSIKMYCNSHGKRINDFALGISLLYAGLFIEGLADGVLFAPQYSIFLCYLLGIGNNLAVINEDYRKDKILDALEKKAV